MDNSIINIAIQTMTRIFLVDCAWVDRGSGRVQLDEDDARE